MTSRNGDEKHLVALADGPHAVATQLPGPSTQGSEDSHALVGAVSEPRAEEDVQCPHSPLDWRAGNDVATWLRLGMSLAHVFALQDWFLSSAGEPPRFSSIRHESEGSAGRL